MSIEEIAAVCGHSGTSIDRVAYQCGHPVAQALAAGGVPGS